MADTFSFLGFQNPNSLDKRAASLIVSSGGNDYHLEYVLPGHLLPARTEWVFTSAGGAQSNATLIAATASVRTHLTQFSVFLTAATTVDVDVRVGFASTLASESASGVSRIVINHELTPGSGVVLGNGIATFVQSSSNQPLVITCDAPTSGKLIVLATYYQSDLP